MRLARVYVARHDIEKKEALKIARKAVRKRNAFVKEHKNSDKERVARWVDTFKKDYLIAGLERMAKRSSARRDLQERGR